MRNKYHARAEIDNNGRRFASHKEHRRFKELQLLERAGLISGLKTQVRYLLIPSAYDDDGKCIERCCYYVADFVYRDAAGHLIVEDCKGVRTQAYIIKRKLMYSVYGVRILET